MQFVGLFSYYTRLRLNFLFNNIANNLRIWNKVNALTVFLENFFFFKRVSNQHKNSIDEVSFLFTSFVDYKKFTKNLFSFRQRIYKVFFFRIALRGLGYRVKRITKRFYLFFFAVKHYFYFYVPIDIFIKIRGRRLYLICFNKMKLNTIFSEFLYLKKMDFYERTKSFFLKNRVFFMKKLK